MVAVEPLDEMRARIPAGAEALAGSAEAIPLDDASVDAVVVGQAFHWFDHQRALPEIVRVLHPGGALGLLWNLLDDDVPWVAAVTDAFDAEDRVSLSTEGDSPFAGVPGLAEPTEARFRHLQATDARGLVANVASRSTLILAEEDRRAEILNRIATLAPAETFEVPYICVPGARAARRTAERRPLEQLGVGVRVGRRAAAQQRQRLGAWVPELVRRAGRDQHRVAGADLERLVAEPHLSPPLAC